MPLTRTVPPSDRNCTYGGTFRSIVRSLLFFMININPFHTKKNLTHYSSYTEHVSALMLYPIYVFYTLKHGLSEMIEIVTPVDTMCKQLSCGAEENPDTLRLEYINSRLPRPIQFCWPTQPPNRQILTRGQSCCTNQIPAIPLLRWRGVVVLKSFTFSAPYNCTV
jgi:hypothetical protein